MVWEMGRPGTAEQPQTKHQYIMLKRFIIPASISLSIFAGLAACGSSSDTTTPGSDASVPGVVTTTAGGSATSDAITGTTGSVSPTTTA